MKTYEAGRYDLIKPGLNTIMEEVKFSLKGHEITGYVIPIGDVNLVFALTSQGLVGCGAIDVIALEKFKIPAVKVRPSSGDSIRNIDDLLNGKVAVINTFAQKSGVMQDMSGEEALKTLM
jgi:uncharacterized protein YunC (DUF1805 family)